MFGFHCYNYENFRTETLMKDAAHHRFGGGPEAGDRAPDFEGRTLDGDKLKLSDFRGDRNVVLTFGSSTCPFTAASIVGLNQLYEDFSGEDVEFLFVYVREAHPGEKRPAHQTWEDKVEVAEEFRDEEGVEMPIVVDDLNGKVHRKYGTLPNPTYIIDTSGRVAFRALWTRPRVIAKALEELLEAQQERGEDHVIVLDGEDTKAPMTYAMLHTHRALERGGEQAIQDFREEMGRAGWALDAASRVVEPVALNPGKAFAGAAMAGGMIAGGLYLGRYLRHQRLNNRLPNFFRTSKPARKDESEYAVGI
ncbi:MAG TPA: redoxin domain-containing protein [Terriglobales bacterium]